jgi:hypothetical protein
MENSSCIVAFMSVAAGTCLSSRWPETALIYLFILPSFDSNGYTCYNNKEATTIITSSIIQISRVTGVFQWILVHSM